MKSGVMNSNYNFPLHTKSLLKCANAVMGRGQGEGLNSLE